MNCFVCFLLRTLSLLKEIKETKTCANTYNVLVLGNQNQIHITLSSQAGQTPLHCS